MSDEGSGERKEMLVEDAPALTVGEQLVALRSAALDDLATTQALYLKAQAELARAKERRTRAAVVALDTGVDADVVAAAVSVSAGTIRNWAKLLEGAG